MPIVLQHIHQPAELDAQDLLDLKRIRADHPLPGPDMAARFAAGQWLVAGHFNDRILGAAWLHESDSRWHLDDLTVRALTRRRGVARQMLTLLAHEARQAQRELCLADQPPVQVLQSLLHEIGFTHRQGPDTDAHWILLSSS